MSRPSTLAAGVILCGGRSSRMGGGDKTLLRLGDATLLDHIVARLRTQLTHLAVNANGDPQRFAAFGLPVLADTRGGFAGPLAGVLAALDWAATLGCGHVLTVPGDAPFIPATLVARLAEGADADHVVAVAASAGRRHPVAALWPVAMAGDLAAFLDDQPSRRVNDFLALHPVREVAFDPVRVGAAEIDPFFNINSSDDLAEARRMIEGQLP
ncbi:MAG: molybdenum cofactor guanylyltransferase MobA [Rhizobiaceae bacterium]|nr:molybdenum cofactor guanylyltransferase MobA [Rhizobiaceae bacterium]